MKFQRTAFSLLALSLLPAAAMAQPLLGRLELTWGDSIASKHRQQDVKFSVAVVDAKGQRHTLDAQQALLAADNLYALGGQEVAVAMEAATDKREVPRIAAIVAADTEKAGAQLRIAGTTVWASLLCKFNDIATEQNPRSFFTGAYGNNPGQLDHYWREVSYGSINLVGSAAHGWFTLPSPRSAYFHANGDANLDKLFDDCVAAADPTVNFAANGGLQGINMMFNSDLDGYAWGGGRCATLDGIDKCWSSTWNPPWSFSNLAPLSHEMGHGYGLPHANNSDADADPYDNPWDVMSDAWYNAVSNPTYGTLPKHLNTWSRNQLGFIPAARKLTLSTSGTHANLALDRASLVTSGNHQMIVVRVPGQPASRYYTIESRKRSGDYEAQLAGDAVIIHAVDTTRSEPAWIVDATSPPANWSNNEGSMFKAGESWTAPGAAFTVSVNAATAEGFSVTVVIP